MEGDELIGKEVVFTAYYKASLLVQLEHPVTGKCISAIPHLFRNSEVETVAIVQTSNRTYQVPLNCVRIK